MRTNIEYSVELKDVPKEVTARISDAADELRKLSHYIEAIAEDLEQENINIIAARIDRSRIRLFEVDSALQDCDKTIKKYAQTITELHQHHEAKQAEAANPSPQAGDHEQ